MPASRRDFLLFRSFTFYCPLTRLLKTLNDSFSGWQSVT